jgi:Ca2+-binding EF-hand superfamily protein
MQREDTVKFDYLKTFVDIKDITLFHIYLVELFKDLANREENTREKGISLITFLDYFKLGYFFGEKLFNTFDTDRDGFLKSDEFIDGVTKLYLGDYKETTFLLFKMYDFTKENVIYRNNVKLILSYLPIVNTAVSTSETEYKDQNDSMNEIDKILNKTFEKKETFNYEEFLYAIENKASDIFLIFLCFFYQNIPFNDNHINNYKNFKKKVNCKICHTPKSDNSLKKLPIPFSKFKQNPYLSKFCINRSIFESTSEESYLCASHNDAIRMVNRLEVDINKEKDKELLTLNKILYSPTTYLTKVKEHEKDDFQEVGKKDNLLSDAPEIVHEGVIFKKSATNHLKTYFLSLIGNEIYYYKSSDKSSLKGMHNLSGCFVDLIKGYESIDGKNYYSFQVILAKKVKLFYTESEEIAQEWVKVLKIATRYENFEEHYELIKVIGKGNFGVVYLAKHKKSGEKVAIKILSKSKMGVVEMKSTYNEIDIMKVCHHPNIIRLLDHFENAHYIYIVMEYLSGGDLCDYVVNSNEFTEVQAAKIMYQIALGLKYLEEFGIMHRDLKPENILLTKYSDNPTVKIMDFGLSKILGRNEKALEGFGTLNYIAPEVLVRKPYDKKIDIFALGVVLYFILSKTLPFDDANNDEENIATLILLGKIRFPQKIWKNRSKEVVNLITAAVEKDPVKRISIDNFLQDIWFKKYLVGN